MADVMGFDANAPENNQSNCVPAGEYVVAMVKSERKPTKDNKGAYLNCEFKIASGEYQNRTIFHKFNLWLSPEKKDAINIAKGQFSQLCRAVGVLTPKDSQELHGKAILVKVNAKESEGFGMQNNITKFSAKQVQPVQAPTQPAVQEIAAGNVW